MSGVDVDGFLSSQRAKLTEEKSRLRRRVNGILPSDSIAVEKSDKLRKERQLEYQEFAKKGGGSHRTIHSDGVRGSAKNRSIAEIRHVMSREREREIVGNKAGNREGGNTDVKRGGDYASLREKKRAEERQYSGNMHHQDVERGDGYAERRRAKFADKKPPPRDFNWEEEESGLMEWTRSQAHPPTHRMSRDQARAQTPPIEEAYRVKQTTSKSSLRSVSAPSVAPTGIAALGKFEDSRMKKLRQLKYAEELKSQMREKEQSKIKHTTVTAWRDPEVPTGARYRGNERPPDERRRQPTPGPRLSSDRDLPRGRSHTPEYRRDERSHWRHHDDQYYDPHPPRHDNPPHHEEQSYRDDPRRGGSRYDDRYSHSPVPPRHRQYGAEEGRKQQQKSQPRHIKNGDGYGYYHPYGPPPPPPPPPRFHGGWGAPYYPYPPHGTGYERDPYMYYPQPHDPYAAPPHRPHPSGRSHWNDRDREKENFAVEDRDDRVVQRLSEKEPKVSPLLGFGGNRPKSDKAAYRKELEKQMAEKKDRETKDKIARESFEKQKDTEIYDPFGKGGCGAPVRDQFGNLVADLKQMRRINENRLSNTSPLSQRRSKDGIIKEGSESPLTSKSPRTTILTYGKDDEDKKLATQENYRDYLQRQVREKEEMKRKEKERLKLEEEKELEQLERDRKRLQEEYQQELERQRRKEEEARRKNEEIKKQAEIKRQIAIMQQEQEMLKEETERKAMAERRLQEIGNQSFSPAQVRAESPPIPTLRHKMKQFSEVPPRTPDGPEPSSYRSSSPPVPTLRKKQAKSMYQDPEQRALSSAEGSRQPFEGSRQPVEGSRQPVKGSRQPVEGSHQPNAVSRHPTMDHFTHPPHPQEVSNPQDIGELDTRQPHVTSGAQDFLSLNLRHQRPPASPETEQNALLTQLGAIRMHLQAELAKQVGQQPQHSDIFEKAKQHKPKIAGPKVARPKESATGNTLSGDFLEELPEDPGSVSRSELQQEAPLHHQQNFLQRRRVQQPHSVDSPLLSADTAHFSGNPFADDVSIGGASIAESAHRPRRRQWGEKGRASSPGGRSKFSVNTLEVEDMVARNEERTRRLEAILNSGSAQHTATLDANYFPPSATGAATRHHHGTRRTQSRQSESSLDCETQHLPVP